jgi:hypothetical protein
MGAFLKKDFWYLSDGYWGGHDNIRTQSSSFQVTCGVFLKSPFKYRRINYTKSPNSGAGNVISRESARSCVGVDQRVSAIRAVEVPVFAYLRSS